MSNDDDANAYYVKIFPAYLYHLRQAAIRWAEVNIGHPAWDMVEKAIDEAERLDFEAYRLSERRKLENPWK